MTDFDANRPTNAMSVFRGLLYRLAQPPQHRPASRVNPSHAVSHRLQHPNDAPIDPPAVMAPVPAAAPLVDRGRGFDLAHPRSTGGSPVGFCLFPARGGPIREADCDTSVGREGVCGSDTTPSTRGEIRLVLPAPLDDPRPVPQRESLHECGVHLFPLSHAPRSRYRVRT